MRDGAGLCLVTGATGKVGAHLLAAVRAEGLRIRAMSRTLPARRGEHADIEWVQADLDRPETLADAFAGAEQLVLITADGPGQVDQARHALAAARTARVRNLLLVSAMLAGETPPLSFGVNHAAIEAMAKESGMAWTILRPSFFMQTLAMFAEPIKSAGKLVVPVPMGQVAFVDLADVADAIWACARHSDHQGKTFILTGSEALSFKRVAEKLAQHLGRTIRHVAPPLWAGRLLLRFAGGVDRWTASRLVELFRALEGGKEAGVSPDLEHLIQRKARRLDDYLPGALQLFSKHSVIHAQEHNAHV